MADLLAEGKYEQIILEHGPFTLEEYNSWDKGERAEYLQLMIMNLIRMGLERFAASEQGLKATVEAYILSEPELVVGAARQMSARRTDSAP